MTTGYQSWLDLLQGPAGPTGPTGPAGAAGGLSTFDKAAGTWAISAASLTCRADATTGDVNWTLPAPATMSDGARIRTTLAKGTFVNAGVNSQLTHKMSVTVNGGSSETLTGPDGVALASEWDTSGSGNLLSTSVEWEWDAGGNRWLGH